MKMLILLLLVANVVSGQSADEILRQKETQRKYLRQQIAALGTYIGYAKKGYAIAGKGLKAIRKIKKDDFGLHNNFYNSFRRVNPLIKDYSKVAEIIALQVSITKKAKETLKGVKEANMFSANEVKHCSAVINNLLNSCADNMEELMLVISDGELEMSDDQRIKRIDLLYADMQDKVSFCSAFSQDMALLTVQRMRELNEVKLSKLLNGLQ